MSAECQKRPNALQQKVALLDHPVREREQRIGNGNPESPRGLHVDRQLDQRRLLDRKIGRLCPIEDLLYVSSSAPIEVPPRWAVANQRANVGELGNRGDGWQPMSQCQGSYAFPQVDECRIANN